MILTFNYYSYRHTLTQAHEHINGHQSTQICVNKLTISVALSNYYNQTINFYQTELTLLRKETKNSPSV